jgi:hypothetical protein
MLTSGASANALRRKEDDIKKIMRFNTVFIYLKKTTHFYLFPVHIPPPPGNHMIYQWFTFISSKYLLPKCFLPSPFTLNYEVYFTRTFLYEKRGLLSLETKPRKIIRNKHQ